MFQPTLRTCLIAAAGASGLSWLINRTWPALEILIQPIRKFTAQ